MDDTDCIEVQGTGCAGEPQASGECAGDTAGDTAATEVGAVEGGACRCDSLGSGSGPLIALVAAIVWRRVRCG